NVDAARRAFETALALDPAAPLVHNLYTHFEIEELASPVPAMLRLLGQIETHPADAALYAGLVTACRYTGVHYTYWMMGDWAHAVELDDESLAFARLYALPMLGRADEAIRGYESWRSQLRTGLEVDLAAAMIAALTGDRAQCLESANRMLGSGFRDAEGLYFLARCLAYIGGAEQALGLLERVIGQGFTCPSILAADPWLASPRRDGGLAAPAPTAR